MYLAVKFRHLPQYSSNPKRCKICSNPCIFERYTEITILILPLRDMLTVLDPYVRLIRINFIVFDSPHGVVMAQCTNGVFELLVTN